MGRQQGLTRKREMSITLLIHCSCRLPPPISVMWVISLAFPESTTKRTPDIVTDVSAMFVERMHLRMPGGAAWNTWSCAGTQQETCVASSSAWFSWLKFYQEGANWSWVDTQQCELSGRALCLAEGVLQSST